MAHKFDPKDMHKLDSKERQKNFPPIKTLKKLLLQPGDKMADIGCGTGYFSIPAAELITLDGWVYAVDTSEIMLNELKNRVAEKGVKNITIIKGSDYSALIEDKKLDFILMANLFHEIEDKDRFLNYYVGKLRKGGKIAILEWKKVATEGGPPLAIRIEAEELKTILRNHNLEIIKEIDINNTHYGVVGQLKEKCKY